MADIQPDQFEKAIAMALERVAELQPTDEFQNIYVEKLTEFLTNNYASGWDVYEALPIEALIRHAITFARYRMDEFIWTSSSHFMSKVEQLATARAAWAVVDILNDIRIGVGRPHIRMALR